MQGRFADAQAEYLEALRLQPDFAARTRTSVTPWPPGEDRPRPSQVPRGASSGARRGRHAQQPGRGAGGAGPDRRSHRRVPGDAPARPRAGAGARQSRLRARRAGTGRPRRSRTSSKPFACSRTWNWRTCTSAGRSAARGELTEAAEQFREVLRINPNNEDARRALATLGGRGPQPGADAPSA